MKKHNKFITSFLVGIIVFICAVIISFVAFTYANRNEPLLYRSQDGANDWYARIIQNPFRDKTKELVADDFLNSIKGKTATESLNENKNVVFNYPEISDEKGKLVKWELWNRLDEEDKTVFFYGLYRKDELVESQKDKYLISCVVLTLNKENSEWKVKEYFFQGRIFSRFR